MPPEGPFKHIQLCTQQIHLGTQVRARHLVPDQGDAGQCCARCPICDQQGVDAVGNCRSGNGDAEHPMVRPRVMYQLYARYVGICVGDCKIGLGVARAGDDPLPRAIDHMGLGEGQVAHAGFL